VVEIGPFLHILRQNTLDRLLDLAYIDMVHLLDPLGEENTENDGEDSTVLIDRRASTADHMTDELDAIRTIGQVLARLPDTNARVRVLRWAAERFEIDTAVTFEPAANLATGTADAAIDPTLSMDGLHDLFPATAARDSRAPFAIDDTLVMDDPLPAPNTAVTIASAAFAREDSQMALGLESLELDSPAGDEPLATGLQAQRAESLIHSFVTDLQRLAQDCQNVFAPITTTPQ
jgi:hypothetical protein